MIDTEEFNSSRDLDSKREGQRISLRKNLALLSWGVIIGIVFSTSLFGLLQQLEEYADLSVTVQNLLEKYWFFVSWYYWLIPLVMSATFYVILLKLTKKRLKNDGTN
jgi:hypothetical protein